MTTQVLAEPQRSGSRFLDALRSLLEIIRDYGMPSVAFGTGIYAFVLVLHSSISPELKAGVALILTMAGLAAQLWMYARHNPLRCRGATCRAWHGHGANAVLATIGHHFRGTPANDLVYFCRGFLKPCRIASPNCPHKQTKTADPLGRRRSRLGRLRTARRHGGRTSLPPMLVQSRRPPRRGEPRTEGGFCSLE